jgi:hypothetical protein
MAVLIDPGLLVSGNLTPRFRATVAAEPDQGRIGKTDLPELVAGAYRATRPEIWRVDLAPRPTIWPAWWP